MQWDRADVQTNGPVLVANCNSNDWRFAYLLPTIVDKSFAEKVHDGTIWCGSCRYTCVSERVHRPVALATGSASSKAQAPTSNVQIFRSERVDCRRSVTDSANPKSSRDRVGAGITRGIARDAAMRGEGTVLDKGDVGGGSRVVYTSIHGGCAIRAWRDRARARVIARAGVLMISLRTWSDRCNLVPSTKMRDGPMDDTRRHACLRPLSLTDTARHRMLSRAKHCGMCRHLTRGSAWPAFYDAQVELPKSRA